MQDITMVEGLPFDIDDEDEFEVESLEDGEDEHPAEAFEQARERTQTLLEEGSTTLSEYSGLFEELKRSPSIDYSQEQRLAEIKERLDEIKQDLLASQSAESEAALKVATQNEIDKARKAVKEKSVRQIQDAVTAAESIDMAFCFDGTDSMRTRIQNVKDILRKIVHDVQQTNSALNLRLAVVVYRDLDYSNRFDVLDFVDSIDTFEYFLGSIVAGGSGPRYGKRDTPEDMAGGIQQVKLLSWQQPTRMVMILADCPCHGRYFHNFCDNYPYGTPNIDILEELRQLKNSSENGTMSLYFGKLTSHTDIMIQKFREHNVAPTVAHVEDSDMLVSALTKGIRSSIFNTVSVTVGNTACAFDPVDFDAELLLRNSKNVVETEKSRLKRFKVISKLPSVNEWENQPIVSVKVYQYQPIRSLDQLQKPAKVGLFRRIVSKVRGKIPAEEEAALSTMFLRRSAAPFAEGTSRIVFHGQIASSEDDLDDGLSNVVLKSFKFFGMEPNSLKQYLRQMEISTVAHFLAKEYNKVRKLHCEEVHILKVFVVEEEAEVNEKSGNRRYCAEEPLAKGASDFKKFCSNSGHWNCDELHETLLRFTEFTFQATNGYLLVSDLQGIRKESKFYLTDPVILCTDILRFGNTNLGKDFLTKCYRSTQSHLAEGRWQRNPSSGLGEKPGGKINCARPRASSKHRRATFQFPAVPPLAVVAPPPTFLSSVSSSKVAKAKKEAFDPYMY